MVRKKKQHAPNRIREFRLDPDGKIGLKELAEGSELSVSYLNKLERGLVGVSEEAKRKVARYLDKPVEEVFPGAEQPEPPSESDIEQEAGKDS